MAANMVAGGCSVSVALCTYNGGRYLGEQLESISKQVLRPSELVICDDGSHDGTFQIAADFARSAPFAVRLYRNQSRLGSSRNFEKAMSLCTGDLIALCDQDDIWRPEKILMMASMLSGDRLCGGVLSDAELINERGDRLRTKLSLINGIPLGKGADVSREGWLNVLLKRNPATGATMMIRASARALFSPIPPDWVHDAWIAWLLVLHSRLLMIWDPLMYYRIHPEQQLGLRGLTKTGARSITKHLKDTRGMGAASDRAVAERFAELRSHWINFPGDDFERILGLIDGKIAFHRRRAALPPSLMRRAWHILCSLRGYERYCNGIWSVAKDLLLWRTH